MAPRSVSFFPTQNGRPVFVSRQERPTLVVKLSMFGDDGCAKPLRLALVLPNFFWRFFRVFLSNIPVIRSTTTSHICAIGFHRHASCFPPLTVRLTPSSSATAISGWWKCCCRISIVMPDDSLSSSTAAAAVVAAMFPFLWVGLRPCGGPLQTGGLRERATTPPEANTL